jgi:polysaccharide biosynthesis/export protein
MRAAGSMKGATVNSRLKNWGTAASQSLHVVVWVAAGCAVAIPLLSVATRAQATVPRDAGMSPLARDNMELVGASSSEIKAVLVKDTGLMVELKRWVAKDAADHGQIITESDLSDDAIFDRLETDVKFRAVATRLLQRYGYLVPKLNPESDVAKEHELLVQERAKDLAQAQVERASRNQPNSARGVGNLQACDPRIQDNCAGATGNEPNAPQAPGYMQPVPPDSGGNPSGPNTRPGPPIGQNGLEFTQFRPDATSIDALAFQTPVQPASIGEAGSIPPADEMPDAGSQTGTNPLNSQYESAIAAANSASRNATNAAAGYSLPVDGASTFGAGARFNSGGSETPAGGAAGAALVPMQPRGSNDSNPRSGQPEIIRAANPYNDVPSLYDMYMQARPQPSMPKRFGEGVFQHGSRDPQLIPMDLPAGPDYVVGPGDGLAIDLWGGVAQRMYRTVDREGRVSLPEVGPLLVSGKTLAEVQQSLQEILRTQYRDVSADVSLGRLRTIRVYEAGDVANPGAYDISSLSTPLNALFAAGGPTAQGSMRMVKHFRGDRLVQTVDLYDLLLHGVKSGIEHLENGDTVMVPPIGPQVTVEGMVRRPAVYELLDEKSLAQVLELAGGELPTAALRHIEVERVVAHEKRTMLSVDIPEAGSEESIEKQLDSFQVQDGDRIRIFPIEPYNQNVIYLDGHVARPGRYSYHSGMRVTDLIESYKDLLPEPATGYAEIIRLNAPDFHPSVESFRLGEALADPPQAPLLQPMDTVRVFSRYDFENPPEVSVLGDVRAPGTYRTSGQIRLSDALHLAGGLSPDAETEDAQVFRYLPDGRFKIFSVDLSLAISGDPKENILLQPRDRLLVHRSPNAIEPATVTIEGEVGKPGRYPLTGNMTVGDLIRAGGGLRPSADQDTADLTRYELSADGVAGGKHETISVAGAMEGDTKSNVALQNGDVLTIRQITGWNDLGASISVKGEVKSPGTYGIRPGERLSSILERAGGFEPDAYPYGAVLRRAQVRELESKQQDEMILRVKDLQDNLELLPDSDPKQKQAKEMALQQYQATLTELSANPPAGRVDIRISPNMANWKNSPADIEVRAGDTLLIPKRPGVVMVSGQVFNPTAVAYRPGKSAKWYLGQSGGPTQLANKKAIFVIRADGSVIGTNESIWSGRSLNAVLQPGDTVVVPEKAVGGGIQWQTVFLAAQVASSVASSVFIALRY